MIVYKYIHIYTKNSTQLHTISVNKSIYTLHFNSMVIEKLNIAY